MRKIRKEDTLTKMDIIVRVRVRISCCVGVLLIAAACSGGGGKSASLPAAPVVTQGATTTGTAVLFIPNRAPGSTVRARKVQFVSPSGSSVGVAINGGTAAYVDVSSLSPLCVPVSGGRSCTIPLTVPVGSDTFTLNLYDGANGTGNLLGTGTGSTTGTVGQTFTLTVTLNPVVSTATNPVLTFMVGNAFIAGTAGTATATFTLLDPDSNIITLSATPSFATPLQLTSSDPHVTVTPATWAGPSQTVMLTYDGSTAIGATVNILLKSGATTLATATTSPTFNYFVSTLAGNGSSGATDGPAASAEFSHPSAVAIDPSGNLFVADSANNKIREIVSGVVSSFAGTGTSGSMDGPALSATFSNPSGLVFDSNGNLFVVDYLNNKIREITPSGVVSTFAGTGTQGSTNGPGATATFNLPYAIAIDAANNLYVAEPGNDDVRKITAGGVVSTLAGTGLAGSSDGPGASASFYMPDGVAVDVSGNVYIADSQNNKIREINPSGVVSTFAGTGAAGNTDGPRVTATFQTPAGLAFDANGNLYIADQTNQDIRMISAAGTVSTYAGIAGSNGFLNGSALSAKFNYPVGLVVDTANDVFVADFFNQRIRKITP